MTSEAPASPPPQTLSPPPRGLLARARSRPALFGAAVLVALSLLYLTTVLPNLGNDPIAGGDEGWIASAAQRIEQDGVFGTRLFTGFYGAEDRYYFNLPLDHFMVAASFAAFGEGLAQARLVSVIAGLAVLLLTCLLGRRIGGWGVGLSAAALLVLLRLNLAPFSGLTLTDLGATVRYDLVAVPFGLCALLLLLRRPDDPRIVAVAAAGLLIGLAALTQFIGAFLLLPGGLFLLSLRPPLRRRLALFALLGLSVAAVFVPYAAYVASGLDDFRGQSRSIEQETDFLSPAFYLRQLRDEPHRYATGTDLHSLPSNPEDLARRPSARLALLLLPAAALLALWRGRDDPGRRLLGLTLLCLVAELALLESTKRFVYFVVAVPPLCIALADLGVWAWSWRPNLHTGLPRFAAAAGVVALAVLFAIEGLAVAAKDVRDARSAPDYMAVGREIEASTPPDSVLLGDNRFWLSLPHRDLRSLLLVFYFTNPRISRDQATDVSGALDRIDPDYILLTPLSRDILAGLTPRDHADFERYLSTRTELVATLGGPPYGPTELYRVRGR